MNFGKLYKFKDEFTNERLKDNSIFKIVLWETNIPYPNKKLSIISFDEPFAILQNDPNSSYIKILTSAHVGFLFKAWITEIVEL